MHEKLAMIGCIISEKRIITKPCASFLQSPCVLFTIFFTSINLKIFKNRKPLVIFILSLPVCSIIFIL